MVDDATVAKDAVVVASENVTSEVVVRCCPVLKASCVSPIESAMMDAVKTPVALV